MTDVHTERDTVSIATTIADWCDERAQQLGKDATRQFRLIVGVVMIGLVLLLVLPPVIGWIDFSTSKLFGGSPPNQVVEDAERAVERLGAQVQASQEQVDKLTNELKAIRALLADHSEKRIQLVEHAASLFSAPLALWRIPDIGLGNSLVLHAMTVTREGALFAAGFERIDPSGVAVGGEIFKVEYPKISFIEAYQKSKSVQRGGQVFTKWGDSDLGDSKFKWATYGPIQRQSLVILRSKDTRTWAPMRPEDDKGERLQGVLTALTVAPDGVLLAAGLESDDIEPGMLILRSQDGGTWAPIRPEDDKGKRLRGRLNALMVAPDGGLLAAGWEGSRLDREIVILRSEDGRTWAPIRPKDVNGQRLGGGLGALAVAPDGALLAAGWEGVIPESKILILRSEDGRTWAPIHPQDDIRKALPSCAATPKRRAGLGRATASQRLALSRSPKTPIRRWRNSRTRSRKFRRVAGSLPRHSQMPTSCVARAASPRASQLSRFSSTWSKSSSTATAICSAWRGFTRPVLTPCAWSRGHDRKRTRCSRT